MKRIFSLVMASAILASSLLMSLVAPAFAATDACADFTANNQFVGEKSGSSITTHTRTSVAASVRVHNGFFDDCIGADVVGGPSAWVALAPFDESDPTQIIQLGYVRCHSTTPFTFCFDHPNELWLFYAVGGCTPYVPLPIAIARVPNDNTGGYTTHEFDIRKGSASFLLLMDGGKAAGNWQTSIPFTNGAVSCWYNDNLQATYKAERLDRGDSFGIGGTSGLETWFFNMRYRNAVGGVTWISLTEANGATCDENDGGAVGSYNRTFCYFANGDEMKVSD